MPQTSASPARIRHTLPREEAGGGGRYLSRRELLWAVAGASCLAGCPRSQNQADLVGLPFEGQGVRVAVFGDVPLTAALKRPAGEFRAQTGAVLEFLDRSESELIGADTHAAIDADVIVYPAYLMGQLADRRLLSPVSAELLASPALKWAEVLPLTRTHELTWGGQVYALPFGSAPLVCCYRSDMLAKLGKQPPETWLQYQELAAFLAERKNLGEFAPAEGAAWWGAVEPLSRGSAALTLLSRAAAYAKHRDHYSTYFLLETMEPLIGGPPFVRALDELASAAKLGPAATKLYSPRDCWAALLAGECALALTWPQPAMPLPESAGGRRELGFAEVPGAMQVFDPGKRQWSPRREPVLRRVPLAPQAGRVASVTRGCRYPHAAWQLLVLLTTDPWCTQIGPASAATTAFRETHLQRPEPWVGPGVDEPSARRYADTLRLISNREEVVPAVCLPGRQRYLEELDRAVLKVLRGEATSSDALATAAHEWREIVEHEYSLVQSRRALERSLGLATP